MKIKNCKQLYCLILLVLFLAANVAVSLHTSKHGVLEHSHSDKPCEYCLFAKNDNVDTPNTAYVNFELTYYNFSYSIFSQTVSSSKIPSSNFARAPPLILQA